MNAGEAAGAVGPVVVLCDAALASAFRLAGVDARAVVPAPGHPGGDHGPAPLPAGVTDAFEQACAQAALVVLAPAVASVLDGARLAAAQWRLQPLVVVLPEIAAPQPDAAFARRMRAALGIEA
ncbi:MAG: hypothetical protein HYZ20_04785 [Burkholderiales bacterium]|nr:hypothetical protein [Burkholderiales bacterium]